MYEWQTLNQYDTMVRKEFERRAAHEKRLAEAGGRVRATSQLFGAVELWAGRQLVRVGQLLKNRPGRPRRQQGAALQP